MILMSKPKVKRARAGWLVELHHADGVATFGPWRTHLAAMNCALAIARTSPSGWINGGSWKAY